MMKTDNNESPKFVAFVESLEQLCKVHSVILSTSGYDGLQVRDADGVNEFIHCNGIEDLTMPNL
jgi:hypothetical protein